MPKGIVQCPWVLFYPHRFLQNWTSFFIQIGLLYISISVYTGSKEYHQSDDEVYHWLSVDSVPLSEDWGAFFKTKTNARKLVWQQSGNVTTKSHSIPFPSFFMFTQNGQHKHPKDRPDKGLNYTLCIRNSMQMKCGLSVNTPMKSKCQCPVQQTDLTNKFVQDGQWLWLSW